MRQIDERRRDKGQATSKKLGPDAALHLKPGTLKSGYC